MSFGPLLVDRLAQDTWPAGIDLEDLSYSPVAVMHTLDEREPYDRMILVAGVRRQRQPGGIIATAGPTACPTRRRFRRAWRRP